jgi:hypothetical protein
VDAAEEYLDFDFEKQEVISKPVMSVMSFCYSFDTKYGRVSVNHQAVVPKRCRVGDRVPLARRENGATFIATLHGGHNGLTEPPHHTVPYVYVGI